MTDARRASVMYRDFGPIPLLAVAFLPACVQPEADIRALQVHPDAATRGETLRVSGEVTSGDALTSVIYTLTDDEGDTPAGISVDALAPAKDQSIFRLDDDAHATIATTRAALAGRYHLTVEAKTSKRTHTATAEFVVK
jgi:hypothetical protein